MTDEQRRALFAGIGDTFPESQRDERLALCSAIVGHPVGSSNELTKSEAGSILSWLEEFRTGRESYQYDDETGVAYVWPTEPGP